MLGNVPNRYQIRHVIVFQQKARTDALNTALTWGATGVPKKDNRIQYSVRNSQRAPPLCIHHKRKAGLGAV